MALKKRFWFVVFLAVLIVSCSTKQEIKQPTSQKLDEISKDINNLKKALELSHDNATLKQQLGLKLYDYYLEQAIFKGVSDDNLPFLFYNKKNTAGCLLIHGFTATPWELRKLGEYLYEQNISVYGVLIEGHGTTPEELDKTTWQDWYASADDGLSLLAYLTERRYLCGQSMGASLAIKIAEKNDVMGVVLIGAPIHLRDIRARFAFLLAPFNYYNKNTRLKEEDKGHYYEERSARSIAELMKLINDNKKSMNEVSEPVLIIQSIDDTRIRPESAKYIYDNIGSDEKKIITISKPEHVLTTGDQNGEVFESVLNFIKENEK